MAQTSKSTFRKLVRTRDAVYDNLTFNHEYAGVAEVVANAKVDKKLGRLELAQKKKLLPLEIAALPEGERNLARFAREMAPFEEKDALSRRAAKQEAKRKAEKEGQDAGDRYLEAELSKLDSQKASFAASLKAKYPDSDSTAVDAAAVSAYEKALADATAQYNALKDKLEAEKAKKLAATRAKLDQENEKLQARFDQINAQLKDNNAVSESEFGEGNIVQVKNLKMYFSGIKAVDDLSFNIREGEIFGLIGPNGAGKTTVFNCLTQFYTPTAGDLYYKDRFNNIVRLTDYDVTDVIKAGISRTFQNLEMVYFLSVLDNMKVGAHAFYRSNLADQFLHTNKLKREEEVFEQRAIDILTMLGIVQYKDMPPAGLPYGVLKKIELARTLMSNPRMIILDEPAAGLNDAETEELAETIRRIRDEYKCTIFLVEHDMNLVMGLCDTVCAISFGKLLAIGTPAEIQENPLVQEAYLGSADEEE